MPRRSTTAALWLLIAGVSCAPDGGEEESPVGLKFDDLPPIPAGQIAPLESYAARDGRPLPVRFYPAESDTTLMLAHGSGYHSSYLAPLARKLAEAGAARSYTPDLRGHGSSPERRGDVDYVDQLEDDLADLVAHARQRHPGTRIVVGGHSSGAGLAVRFAGSRHGELADGFLLLAPYLGHDAPTTRENSGGWARPRLPVIIALGVLNGFGVTALNGATAITFEMPEAVRDGTETLAYSYRLNTGYAPRNYRKDLPAIRVPLLGLIGAEDEAFFADRLAPTLMEHTQAKSIVIEGSGHLDLPQAPGVAEAIVAWLASF